MRKRHIVFETIMQPYISRKDGVACGICLLLVFLLPSPSQAESLEVTTPCAGGGSSTGGTLRCFSTIAQGQPVGSSTASGIQLNHGFLTPITNESYAGPDSDGDGLPDSWEQHYFSGLAQSGASDSDSDGVANIDEYWAGTDPTNPLSLFMISALTSGTSADLILRWQSVTGRFYRVESATNMGAAWIPRQINIGATPPLNTVTTVVTTVREFWRVKIE
jgi:hypothetical protein